MLTDRPSRAPLAFARRHDPQPVEDAPPVAAMLSTRFAAFVVDWTICVVMVNSLVGALHVASVPTTLVLLAVLAVLLLYYTVFLTFGRTLGMRVMGIVAVDPVSGAPPRLKYALYRALLTVPSAAAAVVLALYAYMAALGQYVEGVAAGMPFETRIAVLTIVMAPYLVTAVRALRDPQRRMLHDRVARVVILEGAPPARQT